MAKNNATLISFVKSNEETVDTLTGNEITFDIADYEYAKCFHVRFNSVENNVEVKCDAYVQLEYGDTKTEYKPYSGYFASLPYDLNAIPVESGGNVTIDGQQYIADYADFEKKQLVKCVESVDSSAYIGAISSQFNDDSALITIAINNGKRDGNTICNLCSKDNSSWDNTENGVRIGDSTRYDIRLKWTVLGISYTTTISDVVNAFKQLIETRGFVALYQLSTPIEINLTDDEIEAFAQFYSQCPVTNIFAASVNSDQNPILDFEVSTTETGAKSLQNENTCTELMGRVNTVAKEVTSMTKIVVSNTEPDDKSVVWVQ